MSDKKKQYINNAASMILFVSDESHLWKGPKVEVVLDKAQ